MIEHPPPLLLPWAFERPAIIRPHRGPVAMLPGMIPMPVAAAPAATITFTDSSVLTTNVASYSFTSQSLGTAATGRRIVVIAQGSSASASRVITTCTIGGNGATEIARADGTGSTPSGSVLFILQVDAGTTATIVVNTDVSFERMGIGVFALYNLTSSTATNAQSSNSTADAVTLTLTSVSAGGVVVAGRVCRKGTAPTYTWNANITERYDETIEGGTAHSGASLAYAAAQTNLDIIATQAVSGSVASSSMVAASFR